MTVLLSSLSLNIIHSFIANKLHLSNTHDSCNYYCLKIISHQFISCLSKLWKTICLLSRIPHTFSVCFFYWSPSVSWIFVHWITWFRRCQLSAFFSFLSTFWINTLISSICSRTMSWSFDHWSNQLVTYQGRLMLMMLREIVLSLKGQKFWI